VALLLLATVPPLDAPYLDARLHTQYDNAWFTFMARNGLRNGDARSQSGVTQNRYTRWSVRDGEPSYYTHHPFLLKAAFQQYTRLAGTGEAAARSFALLLSFGIAGATLLFVQRTTGRLGAGLAAAVTLASVPVFSRFAATLKFECDGMLAALAFLLAVERARRRQGRAALALVGVAAAAAVLAHWSGALAVASIGLLMFLRPAGRPVPAERAVVAATAAGLVAGAAALAGAVVWLHRGVAAAARSLAGGFAVRSATAGLPLDAWSARQWVYLQENFSLPLIGAACAAAALLLVPSRRHATQAHDAGADSGIRLLRIGALATLVTGVVWVVAFRQGSYIHSYWQIWLALPLALLAGDLTVHADGYRRFATAVAAAGIALVAYLQVANAQGRRELEAVQLGTREDVEFLVSLREVPFRRLVFLATSRTPLNAWFDGPLFLYYTDRPVAVASASERLSPNDLAVVVRQSDQARLAAALGTRFGVELVDGTCGARLCAYRVRRP
jgi:hypothetical protein